jgi:hypothetical protein
MAINTAPSALSELKAKIKGFFKGKKSTKEADKPTEDPKPAEATATDGEAPTATADAAEPTTAPAGKSCFATTMCSYFLLTCSCSRACC